MYTGTDADGGDAREQQVALDRFLLDVVRQQHDDARGECDLDEDEQPHRPEIRFGWQGGPHLDDGL